MISLATIRAARDNDLEALTLLNKEVAGRVAPLVRSAASRMGYGFARYVDEFEVYASTRFWTFLAGWDGRTVDSFFAQVYRNIETGLLDEVRAIRNMPSGVSKDDVKAFGAALAKADGDVMLAEQLATIHPYCGSRLSPNRAHAARVAWQGNLSFDAPAPGSRDDEGRAGVLENEMPASDDLSGFDEGAVRPVGLESTRSALMYLEDHMSVPAGDGPRAELFDAMQTIYDGNASDAALEVISEHVVLPAERAERLRVSGAFGILASGDMFTATPADEYAVTEDENPEHRAAIARRQTVHAVLDSMGDNQREVLLCTFGMRGRSAYGRGDDGNDVGLAADLGVTLKDVRDRRNKGLRAFVKRWVKAMARGAAHAAELEAAADKELAPGGRK